MSAKKDVKLGLQATIPASRDEVVAAISRATSILGKHGEASASNSKVTVKIYPGLVRKVSHVSPVVGVTLSPDNDGNVVVKAKIEQWRTTQQRFLLIPVSPKSLVGKSSYKNFLQSLHQELNALRPGKASVAFLDHTS